MHDSQPLPGGHRLWWAHRGGHSDVMRPNRSPSRPVPAAQAARLLLINQHYWPDHASTAQHLTDLAESLAEQGHDVHVLCSRAASRPGGGVRKRKETRNGVTIHRVGASGLGRGSNLRRMGDYLTFHLAALLKALALPRFDVVVTLTTPPLIGLAGQLLRRWKGASHVFWSMDLHPDASLALGLMDRRRHLVKLLLRISDALYRNADRVVALGSYMEDRLLAKGVRPQRLSVIPVWGRRDDDGSGKATGSLRSALGLTNEFLLMYSGNHGLAHTFDEVLEAARRLKHRRDLVFVFVGDGPRLRQVVDAKRVFALDNVRTLDFVPREQLQDALAAADAHLVTLRQEMTGICVPSKVYGAMSAARPIVFVGPEHCEVADAIRDADCGVTVRPGDCDALVAALEALAADRAAARQLGEQGLASFTAEYERDACCARWHWLIGELTRKLPTPGGRGSRPAVVDAPRSYSTAAEASLS